MEIMKIREFLKNATGAKHMQNESVEIEKIMMLYIRAVVFKFCVQ